MTSTALNLAELELHQYRNFEKIVLKFEKSNVLIYAPNGQGKTNLLEAIHFALSLDPLKHSNLSQLIRHEASEAIIKLRLQSDQDYRLAIKIVASPLDQNKAFKQIVLNGSKKYTKDILNNLPPSILFTPKMIQSVDSASSYRRELIDEILMRVDSRYATTLQNYQNLVKKRNKVLSKFSSPSSFELLQIIDTELITLANSLQTSRRSLVELINQNPNLLDFEFHLSYTPSIVNSQVLRADFEKSLILKSTLHGAHRDQFEINFRKSKAHKWQNVTTFGSRSEQRLALFFLKLFTLRYWEEKLQVSPILLLDDFFSEFDSSHIHHLISLVASYQTILSSSYLDEATLQSSAFQLIKLN